MSTTVHIAIGNSDDKLGQLSWANYCRQVSALVHHWAPSVHGSWYSLPSDPWQNACWAFVPPSNPDNRERLIRALRDLADFHGQESIAWNESETTFITPQEKQ